ncbi:hypothetical protein CHS0354_015954 [Potamilus streckersoni]|uniref:Uncharacterized protein n=1 Tax=Potamilus streckersoni TaxID=2493646 RepID=A0AAE0SYD7_9BIVA|nr:hypothetical protein CHS0354_015954 [Potamilus streckersoni]
MIICERYHKCQVTEKQRFLFPQDNSQKGRVCDRGMDSDDGTVVVKGNLKSQAITDVESVQGHVVRQLKVKKRDDKNYYHGPQQYMRLAE